MSIANMLKLYISAPWTFLMASSSQQEILALSAYLFTSRFVGDILAQVPHAGAAVTFSASL